MSTIRQIISAFVRREHGYAAAPVLGMWMSDPWLLLAGDVQGEGLADGAPADLGPAVVLMVGGLIMLVAMIAWSLIRQSLNHRPDPVKTRQSWQEAREAVDIHVDGSPDGGEPLPSLDPDPSPEDDRPAAADASYANGSRGDWGITSTFRANGGTNGDDGEAFRSREPTPDAGGSRPAGAAAGAVQETVQAAKAAPAREAQAGAAVPSPSGTFERGRVAGERIEADDVEGVLRRLAESGLGEPRIARTARSLAVVRVDDCRGCRACEAGGGDPSARAGCSFEAGFLEGALSQVIEGGAVVREASCRKWGDASCEFEVWY